MKFFNERTDKTTCNRSNSQVNENKVFEADVF